MAFDLVAKLSLEDKFSNPMRKVERQLKSTQRIMDQMKTTTERTSSATSRAGGSFASLGRGAGGALKNIFSLKSGLLGLVGTYATVATANKTFMATVGQAMEREQSNVMIKAMFDDSQASKQYVKMVSDMAINSPILDSKAMLGNSKSFITVSKDMKQLEKMWNLAERMAAIDPLQGTEGAVFALRELFSGDSQSIVERSEMPRAIMNDIKKLPLDQQLAKLDKYFNKIGMTQKLIDEMGGTTLGKWQQVKEKFNLILSDMGTPALDTVSTFFDDLLKRFDSDDFTRFGKIGGRMIDGILIGLTSATIDVYDWFTGLVNSEDFKKKTTVYGKVSFVIDDVYKRFLKWLDKDGKGKIEATSKILIQSLAAAIDTSLPILVPIAIKVGEGIGKGVIEGFNASVKDSFILSALSGKQAQREYITKKVKSIGTDIVVDKFKKHLEVRGKKDDSKKSPGKSHNGGLNYVPYSGYQAVLHKGETVLTRGEAQAYREGKSGGNGGNTYHFNVTLGAGSIKAQAEEFFDYFVTKVEMSGEAGA